MITRSPYPELSDRVEARGIDARTRPKGMWTISTLPDLFKDYLKSQFVKKDFRALILLGQLKELQKFEKKREMGNKKV